MREIKFRAWDKDCTIMRCWNWIKNCEYPFLSDEHGHDLLNKEHFVLMQFTGLLDKNGKEIYEGDIVNGGCYNGSYRYGKIIFQDGSFVAITTGRFGEGIVEGYNFSQLEIIGNIYENPDLAV